MEHDSLAPDLPVSEGVPDELHLELVRAAVVVEVKTLTDNVALSRGKELGSVGVVVHNPERARGNENGRNALEDEDPALWGMSVSSAMK